jgi:hypothetical protein
MPTDLRGSVCWKTFVYDFHIAATTSNHRTPVPSEVKTVGTTVVETVFQPFFSDIIAREF